MSQLAVSFAGAAIGSFVPGVGTALGWAIGSAVGGLLFAPRTSAEGPRLEDLTVQASTYGQPMPRIWGVYRTAGNVIWSNGIVETAIEEEQRGKGGPSLTTTTYSYRASFAVSFGVGPIDAARRIFADGKILVDLRDDTDAETALATFDAVEAIRFYPGTETQDRDPLIEAVEGTDATPAYRGQCYIVFDNLQLADFGNRIPNITVELVASATTGPNTLDSTDIIDVLPGDVITPYSYLMADRHGVAHLTINQWSNSYTNARVKYWRIYPDGTREYRYEFTGPKSVAPLQGSADEPAYAFRLHVEKQLCVYLLGDDGVKLTRQFDVPPAVLLNSQYNRVDIKNRVVYFTEHDPGQATYVCRGYLTWVNPLDETPPPTPTMQVVLTWALDDPRGWLYKIIPGEQEIYGLTSTNMLVVFDLDFTVKQEIPFTPAVTIYYDQSRNATALATRRDGTVYIISQQAIHLIEDGVYRHVGIVANLYLSASYTNFSIAGSILSYAVLSPSWLDYIHHRIRIDTVVPDTKTLDQVVADLLDEAGIQAADSDLSDLAAITVDGFSRTHPMTARAALEVLQRIYHFDLIETDWIYKSRRRGGTIADATILESDLGAGGGERLPHTRTEVLELPRSVSVNYLCAARDYQVNHQYAARTVTSARHVEQIAAPAVIGDDRARQIAEVLLHDAWTARDRFSPMLPPKYLDLDPGDLVEVIRENGDIHFLRVTDTGYTPGGPVTVRAVAEAPAIYTQSAPGADAAIPPKRIGYAGPTELHLLDLPALREADDDAGVYQAAAAYSSAWRGCQVFGSSDGGASYAAREFVGVRAVTGWAANALADGPTTVWDEANTLTVQTTGALYSATEAAVLNGANHLAVGVHGRWEIVGYRDASDNGDGTFDLTGLLRGRRGTEHATASHIARERVILLDSTTLRRLDLELAERGAERHYKPVTIGATLDATTPKAFTGDAEALKPFSPVLLAGARNTGGDLSLTWVRRTRLGGEWLDYADVPLNEETEAYEVDILDAGAVVRTLTGLTTPAASYTAAEQTTDLGAPSAAIDVQVYQLSARVGRGRPGVATL